MSGGVRCADPPDTPPPAGVPIVRRALFLSCAAGSFHLDFHAHPGMNAALKTMFTFGQSRHLDMAALKDSGLGHRQVRKAVAAFGNHRLSPVKPIHKAAAELLHLGERMGLATLVDDAENGVLLDAECVGLEIPVRVRSSSSCLRKQVIERRKCSESDVLTEVRP